MTIRSGSQILYPFASKSSMNTIASRRATISTSGLAVRINNCFSWRRPTINDSRAVVHAAFQGFVIGYVPEDMPGPRSGRANSSSCSRTALRNWTTTNLLPDFSTELGCFQCGRDALRHHSPGHPPSTRFPSAASPRLKLCRLKGALSLLHGSTRGADDSNREGRKAGIGSL